MLAPLKAGTRAGYCRTQPWRGTARGDRVAHWTLADNSVMPPSHAGRGLIVSPRDNSEQGPWALDTPEPEACRERLTSRRSTVCCYPVQHRASRPGRSAVPTPLCHEAGACSCLAPGAARTGAARGPGWAGGWTREGPGYPVDNGGRARYRRDELRSEGSPGPLPIDYSCRSEARNIRYPGSSQGTCLTAQAFGEPGVRVARTRLRQES